jgi:hypothetical protein
MARRSSMLRLLTVRIEDWFRKWPTIQASRTLSSIVRTVLPVALGPSVTQILAGSPAQNSGVPSWAIKNSRLARTASLPPCSEQVGSPPHS